MSLVIIAAGVAVVLVIASLFSHMNVVSLIILWILYALLFMPLGFKPLRRKLFTQKILLNFKHVMPQMSETEQQALEAGTVGWTGALFSGAPDWQALLAKPGPQLSVEEQAFIDGPTETLCQMLNDWQISRSMTIPDDVWNFIKDEGFFSMIIPKHYGGKEFSAMAHSHVIAKISGVSIAVATSVGVPNSLGPAELLLHYGTDQQREYYLPRLARGEEIPCFALTSPRAGSDAGAIEDHGVICRASFEGKEQLCMRLNWNKRYITLSPIATLLGLAFKLYDPEHLLGEVESLGITCALIPTHFDHVVTGRRHYPLDSAFPNGPTQGKDVIIPIDYIIGGQEMIGQGWRMLMECLAVGRSISLPSMVVGGAKRATLCGGAYARIRRQFHTYIGHFEGVQMALARMAAHTYMLDAVRNFTIASVDQGERPVVESAISKYHTTELARSVTMDAMDVHGGKAICMGPKNYMAQGYFELPISITVEGANILTRSMIIFGQGAMRCHPFILSELKAASLAQPQQSLIEFDKAVFAHAGFMISNQLRSLVLSVTGGRFSSAPKGPLKRYYQQFLRFSSALALLADLSMLTIGGALKRLENLSARLGDILSYLYMGSAVLKQHALTAEDKQAAMLPVVQWLCQDLLYQLQNTIHELLINFPNQMIAGALRAHIFPFGRHFNPPNDRLTSVVATMLVEPSVLRQHLMQGVYASDAQNNIVKQMNQILEQAIEVEPLIQKLNHATRDKLITGMTFEALVADAIDAQLLTASEGQRLLEVNRAKFSIIDVDDFAPEEITQAFKGIHNGSTMAG